MRSADALRRQSTAWAAERCTAMARSGKSLHRTAADWLGTYVPCRTARRKGTACAASQRNGTDGIAQMGGGKARSACLAAAQGAWYGTAARRVGSAKPGDALHGNGKAKEWRTAQWCSEVTKGTAAEQQSDRGNAMDRHGPHGNAKALKGGAMLGFSWRGNAGRRRQLRPGDGSFAWQRHYSQL